VNHNKKITRLLLNPSFQVLVALICAVLLGYFFPEAAIKTSWMGTTFVNIIKIFIPPIIFLTILTGISSMGDLKKVGRIGIKSLIYFELVTTISLSLGIVLASLIKPGKIDKAGILIQDPSNYTRHAIAGFDWSRFFLNNLTLQVLILAIVTGVIVSLNRHKDKIISIVDPITKFVFRALKYTMVLAPLGAFGGMASTVGKFGIKTLLPLAVYFCCIGIDPPLLQAKHLEIFKIHQRRNTYRVGHFVFGSCASFPYEQIGANGLQ
jgi:aerobic C4-dicarboxylate transport protein